MPGELSLAGKLFLLERLRAEGVTHIVFAGGEPLSSPDAVETIQFASSLGIKVSLQTNAFFPNRLRETLPCLDWLAIPIDGTSAHSQKIMRTSADQLQRTIEATRLFREYSHFGAKLKIGTVVTPVNIIEMEEISAIVEGLQPDIWKWYQLRPRGEGAKSFKELHLSQEAIFSAQTRICSRRPNQRISISLIEESQGAYLIINPDSEALIPKIDEYLSFGKLVEIISGHLSFNQLSWKKFAGKLNLGSHKNNMAKSFPGWTQHD